MNKETLNKGCYLLARQFPKKHFDSELMWEFLKHLPDDEFLNAIAEIIQNTEEINAATNMIAVINNAVMKKRYKTAEEAWRIVYGQAQSIGHWGEPNINDPVINKTIATIGWKEICTCDIERIDILRAHFFRIYASYMERAKTQSSPRILTAPEKGEITDGTDNNSRTIASGE